jgi:CubicO group peptidase (beta-lactamase class C family)
MSRLTDRRNFIKRAMAVTGAAWMGPSRQAILNASEVREGLNVSNLEHLKEQLAARKTTGLLVRRHNQTVYEWYAPGWGPERRHFTASMAKSLVGGMSLLVALNDGRISAGDPAWKYIPQWKGDPLKSRITIRQLATHTSGLEDAEEGGKPHAKLTG